MLELKIDSIVQTLGVSKSQVHIIENYKSDNDQEASWQKDERNKLVINYKALRLLHECSL